MKKIYFLIIMLATSCQNCHETQVPYYEEEPYESIEEVDKKLGYNVLESTWKRVDGLPILDVNPLVRAKVVIVNESEHGGEFKVVEKFKGDVHGEFKLEATKFISAGETMEFNFEEELSEFEAITSLGYHVEPAIIKVKERVTKMRSITKYRTCNSCDVNCY